MYFRSVSGVAARIRGECLVCTHWECNRQFAARIDFAEEHIGDSIAVFLAWIPGFEDGRNFIDPGQQYRRAALDDNDSNCRRRPATITNASSRKARVRERDWIVISKRETDQERLLDATRIDGRGGMGRPCIASYGSNGNNTEFTAEYA